MPEGRRVHFRIIAIAAIVAPLPALAQALPTERELREECSASSQAGMADCLAAKASASTAALAQAETRLRARIAKWDEGARFKTAARTRFAESQTAFYRYRTAACAFNSSLGGGAIGHALSMRRLACIAELNLRRAELLDRAATDLP
jgi:Lysozyme inhibitor LprI